MSAPIDPRAFRQVLGQFCTGITIITSVHDDAPVGFACQSFAALSLDPPLVLFCPTKVSRSWKAIEASGQFCVNVLTEKQDRIAVAFAGMAGAGDKFAVGEWVEMKTGAPALVDAAAAFDCRLASISDQSTHSVMFGDVLATRHLAGEDTLLYGVRRFRQLRKIFSAIAGDDEYL